MLFLYIPIVVMIAQSFNAGKSRAKWEGFSFRWYAELFQDRSIMQALQVTIAVAVIAAVIATILGTLAAIGIYSMKRRPQSVMMTLTNIPMTMPDIVTGISLMLSVPVYEGGTWADYHDYGTHHLQYALCHIVRHAQAQADEQAQL